MQTGVAIVDTGIYRHRDFGSRITGFVDLVHGKNSVYDDSGHRRGRECIPWTV